MPKLVLNSRISYNNVYGRVNQHDIWLNQYVTSTSSPTFANLQLTGDAYIEGNLYVEGNTTIFNTDITEIQDNIILVNSRETGPGVTLNQAGFEVERGSQENYRFVYNELYKTGMIGRVSNLEPIVVRELIPMQNGVMIWSSQNQRIEAVDSIPIPITVSSTVNSTSLTTGAISLRGGLSVAKDQFIGGRIYFQGTTHGITSQIYTNTGNNLIVSSPNDIYFNPQNTVGLPVNKSISFSNTQQSISSDNIGNLNIKANSNINLTTNMFINIPNSVPVSFSTTSETVYADALNNMNVTSSQDIKLTPAAGKKVLLPVDIPLAFNSSQQKITGNAFGDMSINASNEINLIPGPALNINVPTDSAIKFGNTGTQKIVSDSNSVLTISATGDINLSSGSHVNVPNNIPLTFNSYSQEIRGTTNGNLNISVAVSKLINVNGILSINNTIDSVSATDGAMIIAGGLGVAKTINAGKSIEITNSDISDAQKSIVIKSVFDTTNGYYIGHGRLADNTGRDLSINIPSYTDYNNTGDIPRVSVMSGSNGNSLMSIQADSGITTINGTVESSSSTTGVALIKGGLGVVKNIYTSGKIVSNVISNSALDISGVLNVDTNNSVVSIKSTVDSVDTSLGSMIIAGGIGITKRLNVGGKASFYTGIDMQNTTISNLANPTQPQDAATKAYVDLVKQGLYVKDSVKVATTTDGNLATAFVAGTLIDNYTLQLNDRILIKDQQNGVENGIYNVTNSVPIRTLDLQANSSASGIFVFVMNGDTNNNLGWICNTPSGSDIVSINALSFTQFTGLGQVQDGDGLTKNFNTLNVNVDNVSLEIISDALRIKNTALGTGLTGGSGTTIQTLSDQSHVTMLGSITSGTWGAAIIDVPYGGTGKNAFSTGSILFGNNTNALDTTQTLFFDKVNTRLGVGTNTPSDSMHIFNSNGNSSVLIEADGVNAKPELRLSYSASTKQSIVAMTRNANEYANDTYPDSFILANDQNDNSSVLQFATKKQVRMTIASGGNVGINNSNPNYQLTVGGDVGVSGPVYINDTTNVVGTIGALNIAGGVSIMKDLYIGGSLNIGSSTSGFLLQSLTITSSTPSINSSAGALISYGGISIQNSVNSVSSTSGGAITILGGAGINGDVYVGGSLNINNLQITSDTTSNIITSTLPIIFNNNLQIGDTLFTPTSGNLTISGSNGSSGNVLNLQKTSINLTNTTNTNVVVSSTTSGNINILANGVSNTLNIGLNSTGGQLSTVLSNAVGTSKVEFVPSVSSANLNITNVNTTFNDTVNINKLELSGNGLRQSIVNANGNREWYYFGQLNNLNGSGYCEIDLSSGVNVTNVSGVKVLIAVNNTVANISHSHYGDLDYTSVNKPVVYVYQDTALDYHLFTQVASNSETIVNVITNKYKFNILSEGVSTSPSGIISGYTGSWVETYNTNTISNLETSFGSTDIQNLNVRDSFVLNYNTNSSKDIATLYQRYQLPNDNGQGDVVNDNPTASDTIPAQIAVTLSQIVLSNAMSSVDNFYKGWWIKITSGTNTNQVRRILSYNGSLRVIGLETPFTTQNPILGDSVELYSHSYVGTIYNENNNIMTMSYTSYDTNVQGEIDLKVSKLISTSTTSSLNGSTGSVVLGGGLSIYNTSDSMSITNGGSITTLGGVSIGKKLFVNSGVGIGDINNLTTSFAIKQNNATIKLESTSGGYSYMDMSETGNQNRFGLLMTNNQFMITSNTSGLSPELSVPSIVVNSSGNVGINTTGDINSPLAIESSNFISTNNSSGYLGLIGSATNVNSNSESARVILNSNNVSGTLGLYAGNVSSGNVSMYSSNDIEGLRLDSLRTVTIFSTKISTSGVSAALVVNGGLSINATANAVNVSNGGSLTVNGGVAINKDLHLGGNLFVTGTVITPGNITTPIVAITETTNCYVNDSYNNNLITVSNAGFLTFTVELVPNTASENCGIEFNLPGRATPFTKRGEVVVSVSGYTDDTNVIPLFNVIGTGVVGKTTAILKFQSISTNIHYLTMQCTYLLA
jgi:hypothetical protein